MVSEDDRVRALYDSDGTGTFTDASARIPVNDGSSHFRDETAATLPATARGRCFDVEVAGFGQDGRLDLYFAHRGDPDRLLLGAGP